MRIEGKVFVVTGGGNGIGREVVAALLAKGGRVAAVDISEDGLAETARLTTVGDRLSTHRCDITDIEAVRALAGAVEASHGHVDGLLNVAGIIQPFVPLAELERSTMEQVMAVNFWGVVNTCTTFLPLLSARPEASVVNVSSMGGFTPVPGQTVYGASKAAVKLLTEGLYAEMRGTNVAVTVVFPGGVATDITTNSGVDLPGRPAGPEAEAPPTSMTTAADAAAQIIAAVEEGTYRVVIGKDARALDVMSRLTPRRATDLVAKKMASLLDR